MHRVKTEAEDVHAGAYAGRWVDRPVPKHRLPDEGMSADAAYCLVSKDGTSVAGACVSRPTLLADGRIRLTEHWRRLDGSTGVSYVEEVPP